MKWIVLLMILCMIGSVSGLPWLARTEGDTVERASPAPEPTQTYQILVDDKKVEKGSRILTAGTEIATGVEEFRGRHSSQISGHTNIINVDKATYDRVTSQEGRGGYYNENGREIIYPTANNNIVTVYRDDSIYTRFNDRELPGDRTGEGDLTIQDGKLQILDGDTLTSTLIPISGGMVREENTKPPRYTIYDGTRELTTLNNNRFSQLFPQGTRGSGEESNILPVIKILEKNNALDSAIYIPKDGEGIARYEWGDQNLKIRGSGDSAMYTVTEGKRFTTYNSEGDKTGFSNAKAGEESTWVYSDGENKLTISFEDPTKKLEFIKNNDGHYISTQGDVRKLIFNPRTGELMKEKTAGKGDWERCTKDCAAFAAKIKAGAIAQQPPRREPRGLLYNLNQFMEGYSEYSGLGFWSGLFTDDEEIAEKKKELQDKFCDYIVLGGVECWTSKICEAKIDGTLGGSGVMTMTDSGSPKAAAHVEAEMSEPIRFYNESLGDYTYRYLYRISYSVHNPNDQNMTYTLSFHGPERNVNAVIKTISPGSTRRAVHSRSIAKYSNYKYNKICLRFTPGIERAGGGTADSICNEIVGYGHLAVYENLQPEAEIAAYAVEKSTFQKQGISKTEKDWEDF